jgi:nucleoside-diphosphate-sugar epimerase
VKRVLITGGGGYFGKRFIAYLEDKGGFDITVSARSSGSNKAHPSVKVVIGDLADPKTYSGISKDFDIVVHCASNTDHFAKKVDSYRDNVLATTLLLKHFESRAITFIYLSSEAVFLGDGDLGMLNEKSKIPHNDISTYSEMKKRTERLVQEFAKINTNSRYIILRPRMIWGGDDSPVLKKLKSALDSKTFVWVDRGGYLTSATHYINLCNAVFQSFTNGVTGQAYLIADDHPIIFSSFVRSLVGEDPRLRTAPSIPRGLAFALALLGDMIYSLSRQKFRPPISRSAYYLSLSSVVLDLKDASKELNYSPERTLVNYL